MERKRLLKKSKNEDSLKIRTLFSDYCKEKDNHLYLGKTKIFFIVKKLTLFWLLYFTRKTRETNVLFIIDIW